MVLLIWPPVGRIFVHRFWFFGGVDPFWSFLDNFWYPAVLQFSKWGLLISPEHTFELLVYRSPVDMLLHVG